jgi:hypothetical protein
MPDFDLWIEISQDVDHPGERLDEVSSHDKLPAKPMFRLTRDSGVIRACVALNDRFPLRNAVLNLVVPDHCMIEPLSTTGRHRLAPTVTAEKDVNPDPPHGVRFTIRDGDLNPNSYTTIAAVITPQSGSIEPFRVMLGLSYTPSPKAPGDSRRFALVAPRDYRGTRDLD